MKMRLVTVVCCFLLPWRLSAASHYKGGLGRAVQYANGAGKASGGGTIGDEGKVVDRYGRQIGKVEGGTFYKKIGAAVGTGQEILFDSNGKAWPMSVDNKGNLCYDPVRSPNYNNIPHGFDVPICATGTDDAMQQASHMLDNACTGGKEECMALVKSGNSYVLKRVDKGDGDATSVSGEFSISKGEDVVAFLHNHPEVKGQDSFWPSESDIISALQNDCSTYIRDCATGRLGVFNPNDGQVYEVVDGKRKLLTRDFGDYIRRGDGHDPYEFGNLAALREKAAKKTSASGRVESAQLKLSEKVGIRGWCACLEKQETSGARSIMVGSPWECLEDPARPMPRYSYCFCLRCGKCRRPNLKWDDSSSRRIFDNQLEIQLAATNGLRTCDYVNARKDVERKFINIPDGQIVFPGKCSCKEPDPIRDGFMNNYVCVRCGLCYVPVNNTVPIGPTAREEWGLK